MIVQTWTVAGVTQRRRHSSALQVNAEFAATNSKGFWPSTTMKWAQRRAYSCSACAFSRSWASCTSWGG